MDKIEFYARCDRLLGQTHAPPPEIKYRGRWGPREPGSGRYEKYGLIRWFSEHLVHVSLTDPIKINRTMTAQQVIDLLDSVLVDR
jgi:hypothetical protein